MVTSIESDETTQQAPWALANAVFIEGVGTATPPTYHSQEDLLKLFRITDQKVCSLFRESGIRGRFLVLAPSNPDSEVPTEDQSGLLIKHRTWAVLLACDAVRSCLTSLKATLSDVAYICCVTSTGFLVPSLSALVATELHLEHGCARLDVVGMGCNAGLNALSAAGSWSAANPSKLSILVCVEVCSAAYVFDGSMRSSVVNSLFGDGAAAVALRGTATVNRDRDMRTPRPAPCILKFSSRLIPETIESMRFEWDTQHDKFNFFLAPEVPYVIGAHVAKVIGELLDGTSLTTSAIDHWIIHGGGKKVIDAVRVNLALTAHDVRHTMSVLRDYGNLSSASFLFSYERMLKQDNARPGDYGVFMTMGPGASVEAALVQWH